LDWENNRAEEPNELGPIYKAIEHALRALGPALIQLMLLSFRAGKPRDSRPKRTFTSLDQLMRIQDPSVWSNVSKL
jgi:hypothetical protein